MPYSEIFSHIVAYMELSVTPVYSEPMLCRIPAYLETKILCSELYQGVFWHIQNAV